MNEDLKQYRRFKQLDQNKRRIFSLHRSFLVNADSNVNFTFQLTDSLRSFMLRSVTWEYVIDGPYVGAALNNDTFLQNAAPAFRAQVFFGDADQIHVPIDEGTMNIAMVAGADFNGVRFYIPRPGQWFFESWKVRETLPVRVDLYNNDPINAFNCRWDLLIETELYENN